MLKQAMLAIATEKIKASKGVLKKDEPPQLTESELQAQVDARHSSAIPARLSAFRKPVTASKPPSETFKLGEVLSRSGKLTRPEVADAVSQSRERGEKLGDYLVREGVLTHKDVLQARSVQTGLPYVDLDMSKVDDELMTLFPFSKMQALGFVPFASDGRTVRIASGNPLLKLELAELERICGMKIEAFLCREEIPRAYLEALAQTAETHRRAHLRFKVSLPAAFQCYNEEGGTVSDAVFRGRTLDISEGGLQVTGPMVLGVDPEELKNKPFKVVVTVGAIPQDIVGVCETRHVHFVRGHGGGTSVIYGLKLNQMSSTHRDILGALLSKIHRSQPAATGAEMERN